jgi:hypothetical protein
MDSSDHYSEQHELLESLSVDPESGPEQLLPKSRTQFSQLIRRWRRSITFFLNKGRPRWSFLVFSCVTAVVYIFWPSLPSSPVNDPVWSQRAASVKDAFSHAYGGYQRHTVFPDDELKPISNSGVRKSVFLSYPSPLP